MIPGIAAPETVAYGAGNVEPYPFRLAGVVLVRMTCKDSIHPVLLEQVQVLLADFLREIEITLSFAYTGSENRAVDEQEGEPGGPDVWDRWEAHHSRG